LLALAVGTCAKAENWQSVLNPRAQSMFDATSANHFNR